MTCTRMKCRAPHDEHHKLFICCSNAFIFCFPFFSVKLVLVIFHHHFLTTEHVFCAYCIFFFTVSFTLFFNWRKVLRLRSRLQSQAESQSDRIDTKMLSISRQRAININRYLIGGTRSRARVPVPVNVAPICFPLGGPSAIVWPPSCVHTLIACYLMFSSSRSLFDSFGFETLSIYIQYII